MEFEFTAQHFVDPNTNAVSDLHYPFLSCAFHKRGASSLYPIDCLLDSGADFVTLPISFASRFNIPCHKFKTTPIQTAGGGQSHVYCVPFLGHGILITVPGLPVTLKETIHFSEGQAFPLMGRNFFRHFEIIFKKGGRKFEVE